MVQDGTSQPVPGARFIVSVARREEKGSDVNVATHLLLDVLNGGVDAAIVISNDSDLRLPILEARSRVPVGLVNPTKSYRTEWERDRRCWRPLVVSIDCSGSLRFPAARSSWEGNQACRLVT